MEIVLSFRAALAERIGSQRYDLWFGRRTRLCVRDSVLLVGVPDAFYQDWLRRHFRVDLEAVCMEVLGRRLSVEFAIEPSLSDANHDVSSTADKSTSSPQGSSPKGSSPRAKRSHISAPSARTVRQRRFADFDSFEVGMCNKLAYTSARISAERPGSVSPLLVYGETGSGKTHLLEGVRTLAIQTHPQIHAVYLTAEQFMSLFLEALNGSGLPNFRRKYRSVDLLIVDDVHFLVGKRATRIELLHTVDTLLHSGKQMVLAADGPPAELKDLGSEVVSRLSGGLVCRIEPPDHPTRLGIVRRLAKNLGMSIPSDVQALVAGQVTNNAWELAGALRRLHAMSVAHQQPISLSLAEDALRELQHQCQPVVDLDDIRKAVCQVFGLSPGSLQSGRKTKAISQPRMLAMWLARKHTRAALSEIGHYFGRRSHSTVISAHKKVDRWMSQRTRVQGNQQMWDVDEAIRRVEQKLRIA